VKGAVITSGKDSFIAGADLKDLVGVFERIKDPAEIYKLRAQLSRCCSASSRPAASRWSPPSTARRWAAGSSSASPAITASR
jgi:hypothetical protein